MFASEYDGYLKKNLVFRKSPQEMLAHPPFSDILASADESYRNEIGAVPEAAEVTTVVVEDEPIVHCVEAEHIPLVSSTNEEIHIATVDEATISKLKRLKKDVFQRVRTQVQLRAPQSPPGEGAPGLP